MKIKNFIVSFYSSNFPHFTYEKQETSIRHQKKQKQKRKQFKV